MVLLQANRRFGITKDSRSPFTQYAGVYVSPQLWMDGHGLSVGGDIKTQQPGRARRRYFYGAAIARGTSPHIPKVFGFEAREHSSPYTQRIQLQLQSLSFTVLGAMSESQHNLAVLISGNGSNLQALIDACATGRLPSTRVSHVISK
jgi:hypothetical protein